MNWGKPGKRRERIEGTPFTRRRITLDLAETPAEMVTLMRRLARRVATGARDPWAANRKLAEAAGKALERERAAMPAGSRFKPREDAGWYFDRLVMLDRLVRDHIKHGAAALAAHEASLFGETLAELQLKLAREEVFLFGRDTREGRAAGGRATRRQDADSRPISNAARLAVYLRYRDQGYGKGAAMTMAAKELNMSRSSIRDARKGDRR